MTETGREDYSSSRRLEWEIWKECEQADEPKQMANKQEKRRNSGKKKSKQFVRNKKQRGGAKA